MGDEGIAGVLSFIGVKVNTVNYYHYLHYVGYNSPNCLKVYDIIIKFLISKL